MTIETLELIHKLLEDHADKARKCRDRASDKLDAARDDDARYHSRCSIKHREACRAEHAALAALREFENHDFR